MIIHKTALDNAKEKNEQEIVKLLSKFAIRSQTKNKEEKRNEIERLKKENEKLKKKISHQEEELKKKKKHEEQLNKQQSEYEQQINEHKKSTTTTTHSQANSLNILDDE